MPGPDYIPPPQTTPDWLKEIMTPAKPPNFDEIIRRIHEEERKPEREKEKEPA